MKQVLRISKDGKFHQYLKLSEVRFVTNICKDAFKDKQVVTVELYYLSPIIYKLEFNS